MATEKEIIKNVFDITEIYTAPDIAAVEILRRQNDKELRQKVLAFIKELPFPESEVPYGILSRPIATPNFEMRHFLVQSDLADLRPLVLEYPGKFVAKNKDKYNLCKMYFHGGFGKHDGIKLLEEKVVDFNKFEGQPLADVKTLAGEDLREFHHALLFDEFPQLKPDIIDFTRWFNDTRYLTEYYYLYYLALCIVHGVLYENFLFGDKEETNFIVTKVLPSFKKATEIFGVRPLIVRLLASTHERADGWCYYPESVHPSVEKRLLK